MIPLVWQASSASKIPPKPIESTASPMNDPSHSPGDLAGQPDSRSKRNEETGPAGSEVFAVAYELAEPILQSAFRRYFRVSLRRDDFSETNQDALEVLSDVRIRLLNRFSSLEEVGEEEQVENLEAYARAAAGNAFRDYLRKKYPARLRLSNRIRYILNASDKFASWQSEDGDLLCGEIEWQEGRRPADSDLPDDLVDALRESDGAKTGRSGGERVKSLISEFFALHSKPVTLPTLVSTLAEALMVTEPTLEVPEAGVSELKDRTRNVARRFEDRAALENLWGDILDLPLRHRTAVLLNLRTENGDNALQLFIALRVASVKDLAEALEILPEELAALWEDLPLDDNSIAERLGLTRQQVINLRSSARANLRRKND